MKSRPSKDFHAGVHRTAYVFALGLLTALLFTLGMVPALSRRAMRLARRSLELQLPLSPAEILAERDLLRADFAVHMRMCEQKIEAAHKAHAEISGELGRSIAENVRLRLHSANLAEHLAKTTSELSQTQRALNEALGEAGAMQIALHDETSRLNETQDQIRQMNMSQHLLSDETNDLKAELAGIDAMKASLELQQLDIQRKIADIRKQLECSTQENMILTQERDLARKEAENLAKSRGRKPVKSEDTSLKTDEMALLRETILNIAADVLRQSAQSSPQTSPLQAMIAEAKINRAAHIDQTEKSLMDRVNGL